MRQGIYALRSYIVAEEQYRAWKEWLLQERQYYFVKTIPKVTHNNDRLVSSSLPIEKAVIYTLELVNLVVDTSPKKPKKEKEEASNRIYSFTCFPSQAEEIFKKNVKLYKHKSKLYKECLQVLNKRELSVFNAVVWGFPCDIPQEEMQEVYKQSINKLCDFIEKNHLKITA